MSHKAWRDQDDGYRGLLRNPETGRVFKANATTARRSDLERISSADDEAIVETSRDVEVEAPAEAPKVDEAEAQASDANAALDDLLQQARDTDDKNKLKVLGAQVGVKLSQNMNVETMQDRIESQVAVIRSAGE